MKKLLYAPVAISTFLLAVAITPFSITHVPEVIDEDAEVVAIEHDASTCCDPINEGSYLDTKLNGRLYGIQILRHDPENEIGELIETSLKKTNIDFELDLNESIENQIISLTPYVGDKREFKIEQQFETSMAIGDEGPHWDFTDWKHFTSQWKPIEKLSENSFLTPKLKEPDYSRFPNVTAREIRLFISKEGNKRLDKLAFTCKTANDGPCYVTVSRISFRISAKEQGKWKEIHRINFSIPMGC